MTAAEQWPRPRCGRPWQKDDDADRGPQPASHLADLPAIRALAGRQPDQWSDAEYCV